METNITTSQRKKNVKKNKVKEKTDQVRMKAPVKRVKEN